MPTVQFGNIYLSGRSRLKGIVNLEESSVKWKAQYVSKSVVLPATDILNLHWTQLGQSCQLKVVLNNGTFVRLQGFRKQDFESLSGFCQSELSKSLEVVEMATNGWNWGNFDFKCIFTLIEGI